MTHERASWAWRRTRSRVWLKQERGDCSGVNGFGTRETQALSQLCFYWLWELEEVIGLV